MHKLSRDFFNRKTIEVAKDLLGKTLIYNGIGGIINETEAYTDNDDKASHSYK